MVRARQGANTPLPLKRSPPASFKRLLGSAPSGPWALPAPRALHLVTVLPSSLKGATLPAIRHVAEKLPVARNVAAVTTLVETATHEPTVGACRRLVDAANAAPSDWLGTCPLHCMLDDEQ